MCCELCVCLSKIGRLKCGKGACSFTGADAAVILSSGAVSAMIEVSFELWFPHGNQDWITKSLLSSSMSALANFLIGFAIYSRQCARAGNVGDPHSTESCPFYAGLMISQTIAAAVSFGVGVGADALTENLIRDHSAGDVLNAIVSPVLISVTRGFFKTATTGVVGFFKRCCFKDEPDYRGKDMMAMSEEDALMPNHTIN
jgi:hypothetical protein